MSTVRTKVLIERQDNSTSMRRSQELLELPEWMNTDRARNIALYRSLGYSQEEIAEELLQSETVKEGPGRGRVGPVPGVSASRQQHGVGASALWSLTAGRPCASVRPDPGLQPGRDSGPYSIGQKSKKGPGAFPGRGGVPSGMMLPAGCAARCYGSEGTTAPPCSPCHNADPSVALRRIRRDCPAPGCPYCQEGGLEKKRAGDAVKVRPARAVTPPWAHGFK